MNNYVKVVALATLVANVQMNFAADQDAAVDTKTVDDAITPKTVRIASLEEQLAEQKNLIATLIARLPQQDETQRPASPIKDLEQGTPVAQPADTPAAATNTDSDAPATASGARAWIAAYTPEMSKRNAAIATGTVAAAALIAVGVTKGSDIKTLAKARFGRN